MLLLLGRFQAGRRTQAVCQVRQAFDLPRGSAMTPHRYVVIEGDAIAEMREKLNEGCSQCRDGGGPCAEHIAIAIGVLTAWMDVACEHGRCCAHCTGIHPGVQCPSCDRPEPGVCSFCNQYARDVR